MADSPGSTGLEEEKKPWENPYSAQVLYHTLRTQKLQEEPEAAMFTPEEIDFRQARNAYDQRVGGVLALSGDKRVSDYGGGILKNALEQAKIVRTEHGEYNPLTGEHRYFPDYIQQRELDRNQNALNRTMQLEAGADAAHERMLFQNEALRPGREAQAELARVRAAKAAEPQPLKGKVYDDVKAIGSGWAEFNMVKEEFKKFKPPAGQITKLGELEDKLTRELPGMVPQDWVDSRNAIGFLKRLQEFKQRHAIFGAALVGREKSDWESTEPPRGQGKKAWNEWFRKQESLMQSASDRILNSAASGGFNKQQIEDLSGGRYKAPATELNQGLQATPQPTPVVPTAGGGLRVDENGNLVSD